MAFPDFLVGGSPKAGSTALHDALAAHPQLHASRIKEPKFFMCDGAPPDRSAQRGPGDAHSAQEWIWRESEYRALFESAPPGTLRFESTPFYLWDQEAHPRIAAMLPDVRFVAVIRDPVDRAFSNWSHLWADGLEPRSDFLEACEDEQRRIDAGWAPFWRYAGLGRYGEQLESLYKHLPREHVKVVRYRQIVDEPVRTLDEICRFLGVAERHLPGVPNANVGRWAPDTRANRVLRRGVRLGAAVGAHLPPGMWRAGERHMLRLMQRGGQPRPRVTAEQRAALVPRFGADLGLLSELVKRDFSDWLAPQGRGTYTERQA